MAAHEKVYEIEQRIRATITALDAVALRGVLAAPDQATREALTAVVYELLLEKDAKALAVVVEANAPLDLFKDEPHCVVTALGMAVRSGRLPLVKLLLDGGANANFDAKKKAMHPVFVALEKKSKARNDILALLLERGANANAAFKTGGIELTALGYATYWVANVDAVECLLDAGADPLRCERKGGRGAWTSPLERVSDAKIRKLLQSRSG